MKSFTLPVAAAVVCCALATLLYPVASHAQSLRHLVYSFSVGITNSQHDTTSVNGMASAVRAGQSNEVLSSGGNTYSGNTSDKGEIAVDILGMRPDGGLAVTVNETAKNRTASNVTCVIFASTNVTCSDPSTYQEIFAVLRTLSPNFYQGVPLDAQNHWRVNEPKSDVTIDFSVKPDANGLVDISSQRDQTFKGAVSGSLHATASYVYDPAKYVPKTLKEYTTVREQTGPGAYSNVTIDVDATLASDSKGS